MRAAGPHGSRRSAPVDMHAPSDVDPSRYEPTDAYTRNAPFRCSR